MAPLTAGSNCRLSQRSAQMEWIPLEEDTPRADLLRPAPFVDLRLHNQDIEVVLSHTQQKTERSADSVGTEPSFSKAPPFNACYLRLSKLETSTGTTAEQRHTGAEVGGGRKPIKKFTMTSRNRLKFQLRNALCVWTCLITLTYPKVKYPRDGRVVKKHLNTLLTHLREDYPGVRYCWWLEFQTRGAPHIHLVTTCPVPEKTYLGPLWYHIVGSRTKRHLKHGAQVKPFHGTKSGYEIAEIYASKTEQKRVPPGYSKVGRFWGTSRALTQPAAIVSGLCSLSPTRGNKIVETCSVGAGTLRGAAASPAPLARLHEKRCLRHTRLDLGGRPPSNQRVAPPLVDRTGQADPNRASCHSTAWCRGKKRVLYGCERRSRGHRLSFGKRLVEAPGVS